MIDIVEDLRQTADDTDAVENASVARLLEKAAAAIERLRAERRWIPVSERLPDENRVLIFCPLLEPDEIVGATRYKSGLWLCDDGQMLGETEPTHWMPLPQNPRMATP